MFVFLLIKSEHSQGYPEEDSPIRQSVSVLKELALHGIPLSGEGSLTADCLLQGTPTQQMSSAGSIYSLGLVSAMVIYGSGPETSLKQGLS